MSRILVTGGAGYIGSHAVVALLEAGHEVVVVDNLSNSSSIAVERAEIIARRRLKFHQLDIRERDALLDILRQEGIEAVMHFAGLKAVGESNRFPLDYYDNNVGGTLSLCRAMRDAGIFRLVFSSSATVYGDPPSVPIREDFPTVATNPYGRTKLVIEEMLRDLAASDGRWSVELLRYFNPVGADPSGIIGEDPSGIPNNLLPYITQVAVGRLPGLRVFGSDYPTPDGTGVRDCIHVVDLVEGHLKALEHAETHRGVSVFNLGTGRGYSVLEMIAAFEKVSGVSIPYEVIERRPGDVAECWADPAKAQLELGWVATRGLEEMLGDAWRWQRGNPEGYEEPGFRSLEFS